MERSISQGLNKKILRLALPNILSNLTIPLLGMVDLALAGHLEDAYAIGGVTIATTIFNLIYWNFSFLRMGTTGLTAQAHGEGNRISMGRNLLQSLFIGLVAAVIILLLQNPLLRLALNILHPDPQLSNYATIYYSIVIWGAPASLCTYALNGWLLGMQNTWWPMVVSIATNIVNIIISATLVIAYHSGIAGIATGTIVSQYVGVMMLALGAYFLFIKKDEVELPKSIEELKKGLRRYFGTNINIVLRTMLLALVSVFFTYAGTQEGALTLAANSLLYQFFTLFSYFIDGFAFAAEAVVGHYFGMKERNLLNLAIRKLIIWGFFLALGTAFIYFLGSDLLLNILTDKSEVIEHAHKYLFWVFILPFTGYVAFLYDGIFVGVTATRSMLWSMLSAVVVFFILYFFLPFSDRNHALWAAFVTYLGIRGMMQILISRRLEGLGKPFLKRYFISIGSTLLESEENIRKYITDEWKDAEFSSFYTTEDIHGSGIVYLNSVVKIQDQRPADEINSICKEIETKAGRIKGNPEIALDLDVVVQNRTILREKDYHQPYFQKGYKQLIN